MALIDPSSLPLNLPPQWVNSLRKGCRLLFWTLLLSPFLFSLTEFFFKISLVLSQSEEGAELLMAWNKWAPFVPLLIGAVTLAGIWFVTGPLDEKLSPKQDLRRNLLRPASCMMFALLVLQAASGLSGNQPQGALFEWLPRVIATGFICLFLIYLADIAAVLDQYPIRIIALTMAAYFGCIIFCDILDILVAGTELGSYILPVVAMGKLALTFVSMCGLLVVTGKLHRLLKVAASKETSTST